MVLNTRDLKSRGNPCRFESGHRHQLPVKAFLTTFHPFGRSRKAGRTCPRRPGFSASLLPARAGWSERRRPAGRPSPLMNLNRKQLHPAHRSGHRHRHRLRVRDLIPRYALLPRTRAIFRSHPGAGSPGLCSEQRLGGAAGQEDNADLTLRALGTLKAARLWIFLHPPDHLLHLRPWTNPSITGERVHRQ